MNLIEKIKQYALHLKSEIFTLYFAVRDSRTPWYARLIVASVVAYAFSPIDLIPDFVPVIGYLDDLILLPLGIALAIKMIPDSVLTDCRKLALESEMKKKPRNWIAGGFIIALWIAAAAFCSLWAYEAFTMQQ